MHELCSIGRVTIMSLRKFDSPDCEMQPFCSSKKARVCYVKAYLQATTVDDMPLLRVANRPGPASGLKATSSGSLAVALPDGRRRYKRLGLILMLLLL